MTNAKKSYIVAGQNLTIQFMGKQGIVAVVLSTRDLGTTITGRRV
jgi:hypothetical protein